MKKQKRRRHLALNQDLLKLAFSTKPRRKKKSFRHKCLGVRSEDLAKSLAKIALASFLFIPPAMGYDAVSTPPLAFKTQHGFSSLLKAFVPARRKVMLPLTFLALFRPALPARFIFAEKEDAFHMEHDFPMLAHFPAAQDFSVNEKNHLMRALCALRIYSNSADAPAPLKAVMLPNTDPNIIFIKGDPLAYAKRIGITLKEKVQGVPLGALSFFADWNSSGRLRFLFIVVDPTYLDEHVTEVAFHEMAHAATLKPTQDPNPNKKNEVTALHTSLSGLIWIFNNRQRDDLKKFISAKEAEFIGRELIPHEVAELASEGGTLTAEETKNLDLIKQDTREPMGPEGISLLLRTGA